MPRGLLIILFFLYPDMIFGQEFSYKDSGSFSSKDYFFKENGENRDRSFQGYQILELDVDLGVSTGSCGEINIHKTLAGSLKNILNERTFKRIGKDLASSSFMLLTCYWSPQICSILKSSRLNASLLSKLRMNQCQAINKYIDSRVSDWEMSRQQCFNKQLRASGGDAGAALDACGRSSYNYDMANWSGQGGGSSQVNKLIESSAQWMGFKGSEAKRVVDVTKAFVGDSVVAKGSFKVDFGPGGKGVSPRMYYLERREEIRKRLNELFQKIKRQEGTSLGRVVKERDLKNVSGSTEKKLLNLEIIRSLYKMPHLKREAAVEKLSSVLALHSLATDANKSLDLLMIASQNPNLPKNRRQELDSKRRALKENLETTIFLEKQKNEPLNKVLGRIASEGEFYHQEKASFSLEGKAGQKSKQKMQETFFDCSDGFMCLR
ncbi:MAG: hypothetical protein H6624_16800 [Bdellovibrionaceae bacterium]|nr:hypothetical protein [Bdellovibrionales bacterium]MCB9086005.1 hypothetical protein [Pseudobdellovibrionaceae bacterium]